MDTVEVDEMGFVWVGGLKVCRLAVGGLVEFYDKNKLRSERRGSQFVYATPSQLMQAFNSEGKEEECSSKSVR